MSFSSAIIDGVTRMEIKHLGRIASPEKSKKPKLFLRKPFYYVI